MARLSRSAEPTALPRPWFRRGAESEFLPAALEIVERPVSPLPRIIGGLIVGFFAVALVWSWFGKVDIIAVASGKIIPSGRAKVIQPFEIGTVKAIHVDEGQHVSVGDLLIELDPTTNQADRDRFASDLMRAQLMIRSQGSEGHVDIAVVENNAHQTIGVNFPNGGVFNERRRLSRMRRLR